MYIAQKRFYYNWSFGNYNKDCGGSIVHDDTFSILCLFVFFFRFFFSVCLSSISFRLEIGLEYGHRGGVRDFVIIFFASKRLKNYYVYFAVLQLTCCSY